MYKKLTCYLVLLYGILLIGGGIAGFQSSGSMISLVSGGGFGVLILASSYYLFQKKTLGICSSVSLTAVLSILFAVRFFISHKPIPGILALVSAVLLIYLLVQSAQSKKSAR